MQRLKEYWQNLPDKSRKILMAITGGTVVIVILATLILRFGGQKDYSTLFTGLNQQDAQEVVALLQEEGVSYRYDDKNGAVRIPAATVDQTRAELLSKGYPKSGFTYDMYRNNTGLMTTESDKKQYTLYELQDRLGAQISLFEGIQDARVTIAEADEQKYALQDESDIDASASVVVTMQAGKSLTESTAEAIKHLIAKAVRGLNFTNVAVFDSATMLEVGETSGDGEVLGSAKDLTSLTGLIENQISRNVRRVLEKLYGMGNVEVSVKGTLNMEKMIQESTRYSTPEKTNEQDKTGLLSKEDTANEDSAAANQKAGGVAGADSNADTPKYTNQDNTKAPTDSYANSSATREWLYDLTKEQRQVDPGMLENATVGIVINTDDTRVTNDELINLVADSAGIPRDSASRNITIVRALSQEGKTASAPPGEGQASRKLPLSIIIAMAAGGISVILLFALLFINMRRRPGTEEEPIPVQNTRTAGEEQPPETGISAAAGNEADFRIQDEDIGREQNEEILNLRMQRSLKLKQNIGEFVDQNPQIAAKLIQSWLRGEEDGLGGINRRKES